MGWLSERFLYGLVKCFHKTNVALTPEMKEAQTEPAKLDAYRASQVAWYIDTAQGFGIDVQGKDLLDVGCNDGALTVEYLQCGARRAIGVDVDADAIARARQQFDVPGVEYHVSQVNALPLPDECVDRIISVDVFEHVAAVEALLSECRRVLRPGGQMLLGMWGWYHPFGPHLFGAMPVPWAHVFFSERTLLRTCRRVYEAPWYVPSMYDLDEQGRKLPDKFATEEIPAHYLNKYLIRDFEAAFRATGLRFTVHLVPFSARYARWTRVFLRVPWLREFFASYVWAALHKD